MYKLLGRRYYRYCDMEKMCVALSRKKNYPVLVVTSAEGTPYWSSAYDTLTVSVGQCNFSCCQRGHSKQVAGPNTVTEETIAGRSPSTPPLQYKK